MRFMASSDISELVRRLENILRPGTIDELDVDRAMVRVRSGGLVSSWVRWFARRAGDVREWSPPSVGEQCLLLSPGGDLANGMALVGIFSNANPPSDNRSSADATLYPDGTLREYDDAAHRHLMQCVGDVVVKAQGDLISDASGDVSIKAGKSIVIDAGVSITLRVGAASLRIAASGLSGTPDLVVDGISLTKHAHGGIRKGDDTSGGPQ